MSGPWWDWLALDCHECGRALAAGHDYEPEDYQDEDDPPRMCGDCYGRAVRDELLCNAAEERRFNI